MRGMATLLPVKSLVVSLDEKAKDRVKILVLKDYKGGNSMAAGGKGGLGGMPGGGMGGMPGGFGGMPGGGFPGGGFPGMR